MSDGVLVDGRGVVGRVVQVNQQDQEIERLRGLGVTQGLAEAEASSWRKWLPGARLPWHELNAFQSEIEALEQRQRELEQERSRVTNELQAAPEKDIESMAQWERDGRRGPRPEPTQAKLESQLAEVQRQELAVLRGIDQVASERADHVRKHRTRLVREARQAVEKAQTRAMRAIDEVEQARADLVAARRIELWSMLYPAPEAGRDPAWGLLAGGLRRVLEGMGLSTQVAAEQVLSAMRADVEWVSEATRPEQRAKLEELRPMTSADVDRIRDQRISEAWEVASQLDRDQREADHRRQANERKARAQIEAERGRI